MSRVVSLDRRLREVERRAGVSLYDHPTDAELEARVSALKIEIQAHGVEFPADWERMDWALRVTWLQQSLEAT
jgi:hypothetical protein